MPKICLRHIKYAICVAIPGKANAESKTMRAGISSLYYPKSNMAQWSRRVICNFVSHCTTWMYLRKNDEAENVCNQHTAAARRAGCLYFRLPFINTIKILLCSRRRFRFCFCSGGDAFSLRRPNLLLIWIWLIRRPSRQLLFQQCFRAFPPHTMPKDNYCAARIAISSRESKMNYVMCRREM